jgi:hypothetical protein
MGHDEAIIFQKTYGTLTPDLRQMCADMVFHGVTEAAMESTAICSDRCCRKYNDSCSLCLLEGVVALVSPIHRGKELRD